MRGVLASAVIFLLTTEAFAQQATVEKPASDREAPAAAAKAKADAEAEKDTE
jgi:hypothetical protein